MKQTDLIPVGSALKEDMLKNPLSWYATNEQRVEGSNAFKNKKFPDFIVIVRDKEVTLKRKGITKPLVVFNLGMSFTTVQQTRIEDNDNNAAQQARQEFLNLTQQDNEKTD